MLLRLAALPALLAGCPEHLPECKVLDTSDVVLVASSADNMISDITDGSRVPLIAAPQGGHILLVGARIHAAEDCQLQATGSLRDPVSQRVIAVEMRPLLLDRHSDGWAVPREQLDAMPNVAVCPNSVTTTSIYDHEYQLEVALALLDNSPVVTATARITPTCADAYCMNDCGP